MLADISLSLAAWTGPLARVKLRIKSVSDGMRSCYGKDNPLLASSLGSFFQESPVLFLELITSSCLYWRQSLIFFFFHISA